MRILGINRYYLPAVFLIMFMVVSCNSENRRAEYLDNLLDADGSLKRISEQGKLKIGTDPDSGLPFISSGKISFSGFEVDLANHIADQFGVKAEIVPEKWSNLLAGLNERKYDLVLNALEKPTENNNVVSEIGFSLPYYQNSQKIVVNIEQKNIEKLKDLDKKKIGVVNESTAKIFIEELNKTKKANIELLIYLNIEDLFRALKKKKIEAAVIDSAIGSWQCGKKSNQCKLLKEEFLPVNYVMAVRKEDRALLNALDEIIRKAEKEKKNKELKVKWKLEKQE